MGAVVEGRDPTDRFVEAGAWEHGCDDDRIAAQVRSMRMGVRFAQTAPGRGGSRGFRIVSDLCGPWKRRGCPLNRL